MKKVLIVDDEKIIAQVHGMVVESILDEVDIVYALNGQEAIDFLDKQSDFDLIISDYHMPQKNGAELFKYNKQNLNLPFFLISAAFLEELGGLGDFYQANSKNRFLNKPIDEKLFENILIDILDLNKKQSTTQRDYLKIRASFIEKYSMGNFDVYLEIQPLNYVKVYNHGEGGFEQFVRKYENKGAHFFFLKKEDFHSLLQSILRSRREQKNWGQTELLLESLSSCVSQFELTTEEKKYVDEMVENIVSELSKLDVVKDKIKAFALDQGHFKAHTYMTAYISYVLLKELNRSSEMMLSKVVYAAILHDLFLMDLSLSSYFYIDDDFDTLNHGQQKDVREHMIKACSFIDDLGSISPDVYDMVRHHHELPDGKGFPQGLRASQLSYLSSLFISSVNTAHLLYTYPHKLGELKNFLNFLNSYPSFKKFSDVLEQRVDFS